MNKYDRIQLIRSLDLNTEDSILITPNTSIDMLAAFIVDLSEVSVRVFDPKDDSRLAPHFPIVKVTDLWKTLHDIYADGFYAVVAKPIDPKDCLLAGTIWKQKFSGWIELAKGPCTVRRVTHESVVDYRYNYPNDIIPDRRIREMLAVVRAVPYENCIFELSYYYIPVGWRNEHIIIWDITGDGTANSIKL
jgi:hypothetical protein